MYIESMTHTQRTLRSQFPLLHNTTYLGSCSLGAPPKQAELDVSEYFRLANTEGERAWDIPNGWLDELQEMRRRFARILGASPEEIALMPNVTSAVESLVSAIDFSHRPNVVISSLDFPSLHMVLLAKQERNILKRCLVGSPDGITIPVERFRDAIDQRTALVCTSQVLYGSGTIQDVKTLAAIAHEQGALFAVDGYQATGQIPTDVHELGVDFLVTGTLKWLCGAGELACLYVRRDLLAHLSPTLAGWFGDVNQMAFEYMYRNPRSEATKFEQGTLSLLAIYAARAGMEMILEQGVHSIRARNKKLTEKLINYAEESGFHARVAVTPEQRSALVVLDIPGVQTDQALKVLVGRLRTECNVTVDTRAGGIRVSPHFYNLQEEVIYMIDALACLCKGANG